MHHGLPQRLDVEWYRKRARELLRAYQAGDALARERVHDAVGERAPIKLSDAQHVVAVEHGYAKWADFKHWLERRSPEPLPWDESQDALDEAFALAAYSGRIEAMAWLLEHGADVNGAVHRRLTGLHLAVLSGRVDTARWLVAHGADLARRDELHHGTPLGWAEHNAKGSAIHQYLMTLGDSDRLAHA